MIVAAGVVDLDAAPQSFASETLMQIAFQNLFGGNDRASHCGAGADRRFLYIKASASRSKARERTVALSLLCLYWQNTPYWGGSPLQSR